jgi:hypothetical protein
MLPGELGAQLAEADGGRACIAGANTNLRCPRMPGVRRIRSIPSRAKRLRLGFEEALGLFQRERNARPREY